MSDHAGATLTIFLISAVTSPACSARPTPIMATRITPTGPKPMKLRIIEVNRKRMPSAVSRLFTATVFDTSRSVSRSNVW